MGRLGVARVGHHREFVAVELRRVRPIRRIFVAVLEAQRMAKLVSDGEKGIAAKKLCGYVAVTAYTGIDKGVSGPDAETGEGEKGGRTLSALGDANGGSVGRGGRRLDKGQRRIGRDEAERGAHRGLLVR